MHDADFRWRRRDGGRRLIAASGKDKQRGNETDAERYYWNSHDEWALLSENVST
jgi:hypothetical protein